MNSLEVTDKESREIQKPGTQRVTLDYMLSRVEDVRYEMSPVNPVMTIAHILIDNGYSVTGQAAPADPDNYNAEYGKKLAYEDAVRKLWPIFGFMLCEDIHRAKK